MTDKTIAELREWKKQYDIFPSMAADKEFLEILSHAVPVKEVEPLAVLADRKGCGLEIYTIGGGWQIELWGNSISTQEMGIKPFTDPTYKICEQSARAYLEGLDDKGGR